MAFAVWLLTAYLAAVPEEMEEAARIDGCSRLSAAWRVVLPVARPGVVTTVAFVFIAAWNEFVVALTLISSDANRPLTVGLYGFASAYAPQWNLLMAASLWAILPVISLKPAEGAQSLEKAVCWKRPFSSERSRIAAVVHPSGYTGHQGQRNSRSLFR